MTCDKKANIDTSLHNRDSTLLPVICHLAALSFLPALAAATITPIARLVAAGFLKLFVIPIIIFPFTVKRSENFTSFYGLMLVFLSSFLINEGVSLSILTQKKWLGLTTFLMLIKNVTPLPILFIHSQELGNKCEVLEKEQLPCG